MASEITSLRGPWEVYPEIPEGSIHWRMGPGEDVMNEWWEKIRLLSSEERRRWPQLHVPPKEWAEWVERSIAYVEEERAKKPNQPPEPMPLKRHGSS